MNYKYFMQNESHKRFKKHLFNILWIFIDVKLQSILNNLYFNYLF